MGDNGKVITLPRGWPIGDWCPLKEVIDRMTEGEVGKLIADVRHELDFLAAWNDQRAEEEPLPPAWPTPPPPKSAGDYGKLRSR